MNGLTILAWNKPSGSAVAKPSPCFLLLFIYYYFLRSCFLGLTCPTVCGAFNLSSEITRLIMRLADHGVPGGVRAVISYVGEVKLLVYFHSQLAT